jgi:FtsZ-interacting cell division protein YlmF
VNPKNNYYDRFYVINYLELGKKWLEVLAEDFEDNTPTFMDSDEEEEEESWNEWQEDAEDENDMTAVCLFCDEAYEEAKQFLDHMKETHQYDLKQIFADGRFGFYDRVKFINYIRKLSHDCICFVCGTEDLRSWPALRKHLANSEHLKSPIERSKWDNDEYLIPTYDNDNLLCLLEDILELDEGDFVTYVKDGNHEQVSDGKPVVHDTILEDEEEKEEEEPQKVREEEKEMVEKKDKGEEKQAAEEDQSDSSSSVVVVIPEDLPELDKDSALNDPELVEQLK